MREMTVIFTGQIREREMFIKQLDIMSGLPFIKDKILSTWSDQAAANADFIDFIVAHYGVRVIHRPQPGIISNGFFLHQMCALEQGLAIADQTQHMLKTRTDAVIQGDNLAYINAKDIAIPPGKAGDLGLFREKVTVIEAEITMPFQYDDIFYYGNKDDIRALMHFDMTFDLTYRPATIFHEKFFGTFFDRHFDLLRRFYPNSWLFSGDDALSWVRACGNLYRREFIPFAVRQPEYVSVLALYYLLTRDLFSCDWGDQGHAFFHLRASAGEHFQRRWRGKSFDDVKTLSEVFAGLDPLKNDETISCASDRFFRRVVAGDFADCEVGRLFRHAFANLSSLDDLRQAGASLDMRGFYERALTFSKTIIVRHMDRFLAIVEMCREKNDHARAAYLVEAMTRHRADRLLDR